MTSLQIVEELLTTNDFIYFSYPRGKPDRTLHLRNLLYQLNIYLTQQEGGIENQGLNIQEMRSVTRSIATKIRNGKLLQPTTEYNYPTIFALYGYNDENNKEIRELIMNMFGDFREIEINNEIYLIPDILLARNNTIPSYTQLTVRLYVMFLMILNEIDSTTQVYYRTYVNLRFQDDDDDNIVYTINNLPMFFNQVVRTVNNRRQKNKITENRTKPATNIPPPIQPETGQTDSVNNTDPNIQEFNNTALGDIETPGKDLIPDEDPDKDELEELVQQQERVGVNIEEQNVIKPSELVNTLLNNAITPQNLNRVAEELLGPLNPVPRVPLFNIAPTFSFNLVSGEANIPFIDDDDSDIIDIPLLNIEGLASRYANEEDPSLKLNYWQQLRRALQFEAARFQAVLRSDVVFNALYNIANIFMSLSRGGQNIVNPEIVNNLSLVEEPLIQEYVADAVSQSEFLTAVLAGGVVSAVVLRALFNVVISRLLETLGIITSTDGYQLPINVQKFRVIKDHTGKTLNIINEGEANFLPDPISDQTAYDVLFDPSGYRVTKILPGKLPTDVLKSEFDLQLYNFIGNGMLSLSTLNIEPTNLQPAYSLLSNISEELDETYTTMLQGNTEKSMEKIHNFLPKFQDWLTSNKQVFMNHVNQDIPPNGDYDPDAGDDEGDDDISSGSSGSGFPKKPNKYNETKQGQWYIIKTLIYWIMRKISKIYEFTSIHMRNLFYISYDFAISIYTNIVGKHPLLFSTGVAIVTLKPQLALDIFETFVFFIQSSLTIIKKVFAFFSSYLGLGLLLVGAGVLLYNFSKSPKKISLI